MTEADVLALIQSEIVQNNNNEITANVLRPVLEAMLEQPNDEVGDRLSLDTTDKSSLVAAINEVLGAIGQNTVAVLSGSTDPNVTPPPSYNIGDLYIWNDGSHQGLFVYNGFFWFEFSEYLGTGGYVGTAQDLSNEISNLNTTLFSGVRTDSSSFSIASFKNVWFGSSPSTGTLPSGSSSIIWKNYYIANDGTNVLTINDSGSNEVYQLIPGERVVLMWDGVTWVVF